MSGVKSTTVTISSDELDALRAQALRVSALERQYHMLQRRNTILTHMEKEMKRCVNAMEMHVRIMRTTARSALSELDVSQLRNGQMNSPSGEGLNPAQTARLRSLQEKINWQVEQMDALMKCCSKTMLDAERTQA